MMSESKLRAAERPESAGSVSPALEQQINENLRRLYEQTLEEEVPDRLRQLLERLQEQDSKRQEQDSKE